MINTYIYILIIEVSKKPNLNLWCPRSYTHSIYIVLSIISNIGMTYIIEKDVHRFYYTILDYTILDYTILYKGLEHLWILVSLGVLETTSPWITRNNFVCVCVCVQSFPTLCDPMDCSLPETALSMGFPQQEYWSGLPFPSPWIFPTQGSTLPLRCLLHCIRILYHWATRKVKQGTIIST